MTMAVTLDKVVAHYIALRDKKDAITARHKDELRPVNDAMALLEAFMQKSLDAQNQRSASFAGIGTCFKQKWTSVKVGDWEETLDYIRENDRWDLLTQAVNKTAVIESMSERDPTTGEERLVPCPIPGVSVDSGFKVQVRKG